MVQAKKTAARPAGESPDYDLDGVIEWSTRQGADARERLLKALAEQIYPGRDYVTLVASCGIGVPADCLHLAGRPAGPSV